MNTVVGTILAISKIEELQSKNGNTFNKQCVYLDNSRYDQETGEKYENNLLLEFINLKDGDIAQRFKKGDKVTVSFRLRGYDYVGKTSGKKEYGVSVSCYRIEPFQSQLNTQQAPQQAQAQYNPQPAPQPQPQAERNTVGGGTTDDLPFSRFNDLCML